MIGFDLATGSKASSNWLFCRLVRMSVAVLLTLSVVRAFAGEPAVGSEEARPAGAGLRPPLKRYVRFSRIPLSRRRLRVMRTDGGIKEWTLLRPVGFSQSASLLGR